MHESIPTPVSPSAAATRPLRVAVLGAGSLGSLYGGLLALSGCRVTLIDTRSDHIRAIASQGLILESQGREFRIFDITAVGAATEIPEWEADPLDLLLVCVKSTATATAIAKAACLVREHTAVLTLQNGLGNVEALREILPAESVLAGVAYSGATFLEPGRVREAGRGETVLGELDGTTSPRVLRLQACLSDAGLPASVSTDVTGLIWTKLMANVGINALAALTELTNGQLLERPELVRLMDAAVAEAADVAKAKGIHLAVDTPQEYCRRVAKATTANACSMLQDVRNKRRTEVENINGAIVAHGKELGVPTPVNTLLTELVLARQSAYL